MKDEKPTLTQVCEAIHDKKGQNLTVLDVSRTSSFTDFFVICHGQNRRQNQAICDGIQEQLKQVARRSPTHIEGYENAEWILMDYLEIVVHIFSEDARRTYNLEKLWSDGVRVQPPGSPAQNPGTP